MNAVLQPGKMCWICGKVVDLEGDKDDHGNAVHKRCHTAKKALNPTAPKHVPSDSKPLCPGWQELYQAALFEVDPLRLKQKILDAEAAIFNRRVQLTTVSADLSLQNGASHEELKKIADALSCLN